MHIIVAAAVAAMGARNSCRSGFWQEGRTDICGERESVCEREVHFDLIHLIQNGKKRKKEREREREMESTLISSI
jgi:hypothetical protein